MNLGSSAASIKYLCGATLNLQELEKEEPPKVNPTPDGAEQAKMQHEVWEVAAPGLGGGIPSTFWVWETTALQHRFK